MELKVVEENGVKKLNVTVAQVNVEKYSTEKRGLESALERTNFELGNAERILRVMESLSNCGHYYDEPERYCFFSRIGEPALPIELTTRVFGHIAEGYTPVLLEHVKRVKCPGCTEMRPLIGCYVSSRPKDPDLYVICGNSIHKI